MITWSINKSTSTYTKIKMSGYVYIYLYRTYAISHWHSSLALTLNVRHHTFGFCYGERSFNITLGKIMAKQTKGDFTDLVVGKELLYELSRFLYGANVESETGHMAHIWMEERNFVGWKSSDSECPNFSQYLAQIQILVNFLERTTAKHWPIIDLVDELSGSQTVDIPVDGHSDSKTVNEPSGSKTVDEPVDSGSKTVDEPTCGWNPSWNRDQQVCLNSYITFN
jgi:hypothetical protein